MIAANFPFGGSKWEICLDCFVYYEQHQRICDELEKLWPEGPYPNHIRAINEHIIQPYYDFSVHYNITHINVYRLIVDR